MGYEISARHTPVASVQTAGNPVLWFDPELKPDLKAVTMVTSIAVVFFDTLADGDTNLRW